MVYGHSIYAGFMAVRDDSDHLQWARALRACIICTYWNLQVFLCMR